MGLIFNFYIATASILYCKRRVFYLFGTPNPVYKTYGMSYFRGRLLLFLDVGMRNKTFLVVCDTFLIM